MAKREEHKREIRGTHDRQHERDRKQEVQHPLLAPKRRLQAVERDAQQRVLQTQEQPQAAREAEPHGGRSVRAVRVQHAAQGWVLGQKG
jgi:hypothetical protein